ACVCVCGVVWCWWWCVCVGVCVCVCVCVCAYGSGSERLSVYRLCMPVCVWCLLSFWVTRVCVWCLLSRSGPARLCVVFVVSLWSCLSVCGVCCLSGDACHPERQQ